MSGTVEQVARVRAFNRAYTGVNGLLDAGLLATPFSLTEARVLFELAQRETTDAADVRRRLGLDAGYLSRILRRFAADGLIEREQSGADARRHVVRLTEGGSAAFAELDDRQNAAVEGLLASLGGDERTRLITAMNTVEDLLGDRERPRGYLMRTPGPGDLGWVVERHGAAYAAEYGWDASFEAMVARVVAEFADEPPDRAAGWIAEVDGARAGCVFCVPGEAAAAKLRLLLVEPSARGLGLGTRLVDECLGFARRAGYQRISLWTNDVLVDARRIYQRAEFELDHEERHHSFGHDLVGQYWSRSL